MFECHNMISILVHEILSSNWNFKIVRFKPNIARSELFIFYYESVSQIIKVTKLLNTKLSSRLFNRARRIDVVSPYHHFTFFNSYSGGYIFWAVFCIERSESSQIRSRTSFSRRRGKVPRESRRSWRKTLIFDCFWPRFTPKIQNFVRNSSCTFQFLWVTHSKTFKTNRLRLLRLKEHLLVLKKQVPAILNQRINYLFKFFLLDEILTNQLTAIHLRKQRISWLQKSFLK